MATKSCARKSGGKYPRNYAVRFTDEMFGAIEQAQEQIAGERPGQEVSISDAIRALVAEGLAARQITIS